MHKPHPSRRPTQDAEITGTTTLRRTLPRFRPLHDRVLVKRKAEEERTAGGLYIPENARERPTEAEVIATGPGRLREDGSLQRLEVRPGDQVLLGRLSGSEIELEGTEYLILREEEILGVLTPAASAPS